jgi:ribose transport system substrate-binding protein
VAQYKRSPTDWMSGLPPLKSAPPKGKTIVWLTQPIPAGEQKGAGVKAAAAAVGWSYRQINVNFSDPSTVVAAVNQALQQFHANVIVLPGQNKTLIGGTFAAVQKAGVIMVTTDYIDPPSAPLIGETAGSAFYQLGGALPADWIAAKSGGKAKILVAGADTFSALRVTREGFENELDKVCPGCTTSTIQLTVDQVVNNGAISPVVAALQRDPSIQYVYLTDGEFFDGISSALSSAGLAGRVTVTSSFGDTSVQTAILSGQQAVTDGTPNTLEGWIAVDIASRYFEGMSIPHNDTVPPTQLFAKDNSSTWKVSDELIVPANYQQNFKKIWHVG